MTVSVASRVAKSRCQTADSSLTLAVPQSLPRTRILMISSRADRSGGPRYIAGILPLLAKEFDLYLAAPENEDLSEELRRLTVAAFALPSRRWSWKALWNLRRFIQHHKIEIVHTHGRGAGLYVRLLKPAGVRIVHQFHGYHRPGSFKQKIMSFFDHFAKTQTDHHIAVSNDEAKLVVEDSLSTWSELTVIPNGVDLTPFSARTQNQTSEQTESASLRFGLLTRLDPVKNLPGFLAMLKQWHQQTNHPNWSCTMAGLGPSEVATLKLQDPEFLESGRFHFPGVIKDLDHFFANLDLYIQPSLQEGLPLAVLEAMAARVPCLLSKVPGHFHFLDAHVATGFDVRSAEDFVQKLNELLRSQTRLQEQGMEGYEFVQKHHHLSSVAAEIGKVYRRLFEREPS